MANDTEAVSNAIGAIAGNRYILQMWLADVAVQMSSGMDEWEGNGMPALIEPKIEMSL